MANFINFSGKILPAGNALIPHDNRAFRYGMGLFETMLFRNGRIVLGGLHFNRLFASCQSLGFALPQLWSTAFLEHEVRRTVARNKLEPLARVRLQVWYGNGGLYDGHGLADFIIECFPLEEQVLALNENGLNTGIATKLAKSTDMLANMKTTNALVYGIAAQQARQNKWNDALICNTNGHIIESTIANVFWVKNEQIYTPPLADGCIAGVMRAYLMEQTGVQIAEKSLNMATLLDADEVFLTNSIRRIKWVKSIGDKQYENPMSAMLSKMLTADDQL